ncbi:hypothetical protein V1525DRAFT_410344 [Lipomyces kononenkoae]|uniref:Uncharacterized protein n=1 Tax=Lipomyces kononenkoae TaxID=34357 RepID=A0ACC3SV66_LIPKO
MTGAMKLRYVTFDVFTTERYAGNFLAIVILNETQTLSQEQKQIIAREFNYSETVILHGFEGISYTDKQRYKLDIFTTDQELPFAGHPTIGTACFIAESSGQGLDSTKSTAFITKAGEIPFSYDKMSKIAKLDIPHDLHIHDKLITGIDLEQAGVIDSGSQNVVGLVPFVSIVQGMTFAMVQLSTNDILSKATRGLPEYGRFLDRPWHHDGALVGAYYYVHNGKNADGTILLRTRMLLGSLEDPATGSAAAGLSAFLARSELNTSPSVGDVVSVRFEIEQGIDMGRKSTIYTEVSINKKTHQVQKITLGGSAVKVMEGYLSI